MDEQTAAAARRSTARRASLLCAHRYCRLRSCSSDLVSIISQHADVERIHELESCAGRWRFRSDLRRVAHGRHGRRRRRWWCCSGGGGGQNGRAGRRRSSRWFVVGLVVGCDGRRSARRRLWSRHPCACCWDGRRGRLCSVLVWRTRVAIRRAQTSNWKMEVTAASGADSPRDSRIRDPSSQQQQQRINSSSNSNCNNHSPRTNRQKLAQFFQL